MPFPVGVFECHGVEYLVVHSEAAVDSHPLPGLIVVLSSRIVLSDVDVMTRYVSHLSELPFLGLLSQMATISRRRPLESTPMVIHEPAPLIIDAQHIVDFRA